LKPAKSHGEFEERLAGGVAEGCCGREGKVSARRMARAESFGMRRLSPLFWSRKNAQALGLRIG
jgi:hypothetical protein